MDEYGGTILTLQDTTGVNYNTPEDGRNEEKESFRWRGLKSTCVYLGIGWHIGWMVLISNHVKCAAEALIYVYRRLTPYAHS
jgi:hypothetical protein